MALETVDLDLIFKEDEFYTYFRPHLDEFYDIDPMKIFEITNYTSEEFEYVIQQTEYFCRYDPKDEDEIIILSKPNLIDLQLKWTHFRQVRLNTDKSHIIGYIGCVPIV